MTKIERGGNTIVLEHYPVAKLPADLQKEIGDADEVKLTIETPVPHRPRPSLEGIFARVDEMRSDGTIKPVTAEAAVARIRALRDEWDT